MGHRPWEEEKVGGTCGVRGGSCGEKRFLSEDHLRWWSVGVCGGFPRSPFFQKAHLTFWRPTPSEKEVLNGYFFRGKKILITCNLENIVVGSKSWGPARNDN